MNNTLSSDKNIDSLFHVTEDSYVDEESGWTAYLDDFSCSNNGSFNSSSPSLLSDAAWHGSDSLSQVKRLTLNNLKRSRKNNNNQRTFCLDEDLKDTASSPVNSPKVSSLKQMEMINFPAVANFLGKEAGGSTRGEKSGKNVGDRKNSDNDLRQKGLCVVPMSAFINYFG